MSLLVHSVVDFEAVLATDDEKVVCLHVADPARSLSTANGAVGGGLAAVCA